MPRVKFKSVVSGAAGEKPILSRGKKGASKVPKERLAAQHLMIQLKLDEVRRIRETYTETRSLEARVLSFEEFMLESLDLLYQSL